MKSVCGLDVHKDSVYLCILSEFGELIEKVFGVLTYQLEEMRDLMLHHHVVEVSMESTSVYWIPICRHSAYFALHFLNHQVCLAHLLRELQYLSELDTSQKWSEQVANLFREAIHKRNTNPTDIISKASWLDKLDSLLKLNVSKLGKKFDTFKTGLIKCRDYIFNFLEDPMIPSDNNASERGIRKLKIKLKNSCTFRSDFGADAFLELHSVVETAKKHNQTPFNAIQALFEV